MPQMAPLNWLSLFLMFCMIFMMFNALNYFNFNYNINKNLVKKSKQMINWKW